MKKAVALVLSLLLCGVFFMPAVTYAEEKNKDRHVGLLD